MADEILVPFGTVIEIALRCAGVFALLSIIARIARAIVPGIPYHTTHRGNHRADVFFTPEDRKMYLHLLAEQCAKYGAEIWAWCLMTNHVHLIATGREAFVALLEAQLGRVLRPLNRGRKPKHAGEDVPISPDFFAGSRYSMTVPN